MKTIAVVIGTVPEAIKLAPVCEELRGYPHALSAQVILTGQHGERVPQVLGLFGVKANATLENRLRRTGLPAMASSMLSAVSEHFREVRPDIVMVQGDTTSAMVGALAGFYEGIPVAHIEAGLTSGDVDHPFPEELHRQVIDRIAVLLFAPSMPAARHAKHLARPEAHVFVTGNTIVDALARISGDRIAQPQSGAKRILVTVHRRENHGDNGLKIGEAIVRLATARSDVAVMFCCHEHPGLAALNALMRHAPNITVLPPQLYDQWIQHLKSCWLVISDSGGLQEEAPWLRKPLLVLREETERPEMIATGAAKLVGNDPQAIYESAVELLDSPQAYRRMQITRSQYPYGHGQAAKKIIRHTLEWLLPGSGRSSLERRSHNRSNGGL